MRAGTLSFGIGVALLAGISVYAQEAKKELTVEEIFGSSKFRMKSLSLPQWVEGGKKLSYLQSDSTRSGSGVYLYDVAKNTHELLLDRSLVSLGPGKGQFRIGAYTWAPDGKTILLTGRLPARSTKTGGNFGIFDVETKSFRLLTDTTASQAGEKFSPDGSMIGFVRENNLWVMDVASGRETQLTFDGSEEVLNGTFDWVYEEEFSIISAWEWSPDGKRIAFWRLDQSRVAVFPLVLYPEGDQHPVVEETKYPEAGDPNSLVKIGVVDVQTHETRWVDLGTESDIYVPRIRWTNDPALLAVQRLNRGQDTLDLLLANVTDGTSSSILRETDSAWIDIYDGLFFLTKTDQFVWTSNRDGHVHVYLYDLDGTLVRQVTHGAWDVTSVLGVDKRRQRVLFTAAQASPAERQLYSVRLDGTDMRRLTPEPGVHEVVFSPDYLVCLDTWSNIATPPETVVRTNQGEKVAVVLGNALDSLRGYPLGKENFLTVPMQDGETLNGWMITPPDFDPARRYPLLMYVYGGPGAQTVLNQWGGSASLWHQMLAEKGYIVASVDNRGTESRGKAFLQRVHRRLGMQEMSDQLEAANHFAALPYVDSSRIGIWGWSFGGYMTCMAMTLGAGRFKSGIAVAPVTNWRFYDSIYTERYMDTPQHNPAGYDETSPITYAGKMEGNLLIVHGTADDNVHWQNTITFVNALIRDNKQVNTMFYPGREHGIRGDNATRHLYTLMTQYILGKL